MQKITYLAVLERGIDGYGVFFPDLPGCVSFGKDLDEAIKMGHEALALHINGLAIDGDPIPTPSKSLSTEDTDSGIVTEITYCTTC